MNAHTCCLGKYYVILNHMSQTADVYVYDTSIKTLEGVPIVSGATVYDDLGNNTAYILVVNEDLYYDKKLDHSLMNPNQVRAYGINFWGNSFDQQRGLTIALNDEGKIPKQSMGTMILYNTQVPTEPEMRTCQYITMMSLQAWETIQVNLSETQREQKAELYFCQISQTTTKARYEYIHPKSYQALLHYTETSLFHLK